MPGVIPDRQGTRLPRGRTRDPRGEGGAKAPGSATRKRPSSGPADAGVLNTTSGGVPSFQGTDTWHCGARSDPVPSTFPAHRSRPPVTPGAWVGNRYPHGRTVVAPPDPGDSPVSKDGYHLRVCPDGCRGPLGMPALKTRLAAQTISALVFRWCSPAVRFGKAAWISLAQGRPSQGVGRLTPPRGPVTPVFDRTPGVAYPAPARGGAVQGRCAGSVALWP